MAKSFASDVERAFFDFVDSFEVDDDGDDVGNTSTGRGESISTTTAESFDFFALSFGILEWKVDRLPVLVGDVVDVGDDDDDDDEDGNNS